MDKQTRPYTTAELLEIISATRGINPNRSYIRNVIMNAKRSQPHPLKPAYLARGMWDRSTVDQWAQAESK